MKSTLAKSLEASNLISLEGLRTIKLKLYFRKKKMAAPTNKQDIGSTPKKVYPLGNSCLVCGFSFIQKLVDSDGNTTIKKYLDKKLRLSVERLKIVKDVTLQTTSYSLVIPVCAKSVSETLKRSLKLRRKQRRSETLLRRLSKLRCKGLSIHCITFS